jgi:hypothetical protein
MPQSDMMIKNLFNKEVVHSVTVKKDSNRGLETGLPEYDSEAGALELFRYFTQQRRYFSVDDIRGGTKSEIAQSVRNAMDKEQRRGGFPNRFKEKFSERLSQIKSFRDEVQERAFVDYSLKVSAQKNLPITSFEVKEFKYGKGTLRGAKALSLREKKTGRFAGLFYLGKEE